MLEKRASKVFRVDCFRYARAVPDGPLHFFREILHCDISTFGPTLDTQGHEYVLNILQTTFGAWLLKNWQGKALLSQDLKQHAAIVESAPARLVEVGDSESLQKLAAFLHHKVAIPLLSPHDIRAYQVALRNITEAYCVSRLSEAKCPKLFETEDRIPAPYQFIKRAANRKQMA